LRLTSTWKGNDGLEIITHNGIGRVAFRFLGSTLLTYIVRLYETLATHSFIISYLYLCKENFWQHIANLSYPGLECDSYYYCWFYDGFIGPGTGSF
jgi:hypothetical protein